MKDTFNAILSKEAIDSRRKLDTAKIIAANAHEMGRHLAVTRKAIFDEHIKAGFTEEQALSLIKQ